VPRLWPCVQHSGRRTVGPLALLVAAVAHAGDPTGPAPVVRGPQILMYFQIPLGHTMQPMALYGLRLEQSRLQPGVVPMTQAQTPDHQQLLDLQLRPHADLQVAFGRRVTWDFGRESFSAPSKPATVLIRWPIDGRRSAESLPQALLGGWPQTPRANPSP
jgi:hypothetical protein